MGPLLICKKGTLDGNGRQKNIDREFFLRFALTDEGVSWYLNDNKELAKNASAINESKYSLKQLAVRNNSWFWRSMCKRNLPNLLDLFYALL